MPDPNYVPEDAARAQLERILLSSGFADSPRLCRLLRYLVEQKLAGKAAAIKEYSVGLEVFDRPPSFDPKADSIVRATARKLRARLEEFYATPGLRDPVVIDIPKGGYAPEFRMAAKPPRSRAWPAGIAAGLLLMAVSAVGWRSRLPEPHPSVAVLDVTNLLPEGRDGWLSTALAEMITEELTANEGLRAVPAEQVAQLRRDWGSTNLRAQVRERSPELQHRLGASYAVLVEFRGGDTLRVDTRLRRLRDGQTVLEVSDTGSQTQLYALADRIARRIRVALGSPGGDDPAGRHGPDRDSMRLYSEAVIKLRDSDPLAARSLLEKSVMADPSNFMARSDLAETYFTLGMEAQAKIEAQAALALAPPLPPIERLALEARCQNAMRDWTAAARSYQKLWSLSPDVIDYGLALADIQEKSAQIDGAMRTIQEMRNQPLLPADLARVDFAESLVLYSHGEGQKGLSLARRSALEARQLGARYLYARARLREGGLLMNLVLPGPLAPLDEGLGICRAEGYRSCEMNALRQEGNLFLFGDRRRALELYSRGAELARQLGSRRGLLELLRGMAALHVHGLQDQQAEDLYREVIRLIRDENLGDKAASQFDLSELLIAEGRLGEAEHMLHAMGNTLDSDPAWNFCMAELDRSQGQLGAARRRIELVINAARKTDDHFKLLLALREAFQIHRDEGDWQRAATDVQQMDALASWKAEVALSRAELAWSRHDWRQAETQAAIAEQVWRSANPEGWTGAALIRAEALTMDGRPAEALQELDEIAPALNQSRRQPWQLRARVCRFSAQAMLGVRSDASQFQERTSSAERLGIPSLARQVEDVGRQVHLPWTTAQINESKTSSLRVRSGGAH
ncbi:MAG: hypothetical protein ABSH50_06930 [Bryobacteraceae bacterium]